MNEEILNLTTVLEEVQCLQILWKSIRMRNGHSDLHTCGRIRTNCQPGTWHSICQIPVDGFDAQTTPFMVQICFLHATCL